MIHFFSPTHQLHPIPGHSSPHAGSGRVPSPATGTDTMAGQRFLSSGHNFPAGHTQETSKAQFLCSEAQAQEFGSIFCVFLT